jgi:hypothetical protein
MTRDVKKMSLQELQAELTVLEDSYAEAMKDEASGETLNFIWDRIRELQEEIEKRK